MHPGGFSKNQPIASSDPPPDLAGLEPSPEMTTAMAPEAQRPARLGRRAAASGQKKSWVDRPITVGVILSLAYPSVIEQIIASAIGITDMVVGGHTGHTDAERAAAAAAVTAMGYLQWFAALMTTALGVGATAIVARAIGSGRMNTANRVAGTVCTAAMMVGVPVALLFYFAAPQFAALSGLHDLAADMCVQYLQVMCWTLCFQSFGLIGAACLRGAGDTVRPMLVTIAITLVNGVASPALTFGWWGLPAWGVRGNATGTLLAFVVSGVFTFGFLLRGRAGLALRLRHFRIIPHLLGRVVKIGLPSWLESMLLWAGQSAVVWLVMKQVDDAVGASGATLAAHGATLRIESLAFLPGFGFGIACSTLVGQFLGARKPAEAQRAAVLSNRLAVITMTVAALPMVVFAGPLLKVMVDSRAVVQLGVWPLIIAALAQPGFAVAIAKSAALRGAGETFSPMIATIAGMGGRVVVILALMAVLAHFGKAAWGLNLVWICIFLDLSFRGIFLHAVFRRGKWKLVRV